MLRVDPSPRSIMMTHVGRYPVSINVVKLMYILSSCLDSQYEPPV